MNTGELIVVEQLPREGQTQISSDALEALRRLACTPGMVDRLLRCAEQFPEIQRCAQKIDSTAKRCDAIDMMITKYVCPANILFSQRTIDEYSDDNQVSLVVPVTGLPAPYVNAFPVPPANIIRLTHTQRPGYTPVKIAIDMNIAGGGANYLDFLLQFYLVPGGVTSAQGLPIGPQMRANQFLNKDGTQIHIPFPEYRNQALDIGSLEFLALEITNGGAANNLDSAFVTLYYDNRSFYAACKKQCGCG